MYLAKMIPLESVLSDVYLLLSNDVVDEKLVMESAILAMEHLQIHKGYDFAVCLLKVENNQAQYPNGMLGIEHVLYMPTSRTSSEKRYMLRDAVTEVTDVSWNVVEYNIRYDAKLTNFTNFKKDFKNSGWKYLALSNRQFDKSIICNPELKGCDSCEDWWYPDTSRSRFITSFEEGLIAVTYYRYPQDEQGRYLVLDTPFIRDAILHFVLSRHYMKQWNNNIEGAQGRYMHYNQKWGALAMAAIGDQLTWSLPEIINMDRYNTLFKRDNVKKILGGYGGESKNMM